MSPATLTCVDREKNRRNRRKPVSRVDGAGLPMLEDRGCHLALTRAGCWLAECWYVMTPETRQQFRAALAAIRPFVRQADTAIDADGRLESEHLRERKGRRELPLSRMPAVDHSPAPATLSTDGIRRSLPGLGRTQSGGDPP